MGLESEAGAAGKEHGDHHEELGFSSKSSEQPLTGFNKELI